MKSDSWSKSLNYAIEGILFAVKSERNLKIHILISIFVLILALFIDITPLEYIVLAITISIVIAFELMNTAIERVVDVMFTERCEEAKRIKDIAAGAVLMAAFGAVFVGYFTVFNRVKKGYWAYMLKTPASMDHIAIVSVVVVVFLVILLKTIFNKGTPLHGGMPSGHAAVAFSILVSTIFITKNFVVSILVLLLSILVSYSRVQLNIHTKSEIVFGGAIGFVITFLLFIIFA